MLVGVDGMERIDLTRSSAMPSDQTLISPPSVSVMNAPG